MLLHITEKQYYEEISPNMIQAISVLVEAQNEAQARENARVQRRR